MQHEMINVTGENFSEDWNKIFPYTFHLEELQAIKRLPNGEIASIPVKESKVVFRSDGLELSPVSKGFTMVQPVEVGRIFQPLIESGHVKLTRGTGFKSGSSMIAFGKIDTAIADIVPNDMVQGELVMYSGFDGGMGIGGSMSIKQGRCTNILPVETRATVNAMLDQLINPARGAYQNHGRSHNIAGFRFKHTKNVKIKLADANAEINRAIESFNDMVTAFKAVAAKKVTHAQLKTYVRNVFELADPLVDGEERSTQFENRNNRVIELLDTQRGYDLVPAMRGTMWQGYSAITEYLTHEAGRNNDSRLNSVLFGENSRVSKLALSLALKN